MLTFNKATLDDLWTRLETNDARDKSAPVEDVPLRDWIYNAVYQFARLVEGKTNNGFGGLWTPRSKEWYKLNLWKFLIDDLYLNCSYVSLCYKVSVARAYRKYMANPKEDLPRDDMIYGVFVAGSYSKEVGAVYIGPEVGKEEGSDTEILAEELRLGKFLKDQHDYITRFTPANKSEFVAHGIQLNGPCIQFLALDHVAGSFLRLKRSPVYTVPNQVSDIMDLLEIMSKLVVTFTGLEESIKLLPRPKPEDPMERLTRPRQIPTHPDCPPTASSPKP